MTTAIWWIRRDLCLPDVDGLLGVFIILAIAITYLVIRLIVVWNASRTDKSDKNRD